MIKVTNIDNNNVAKRWRCIRSSITRTDTHKNLPQAVVKTDLEAIKVKSEKGRKRKRDEGDSETEVEARNLLNIYILVNYLVSKKSTYSILSVYHPAVHIGPK